MTSKRPRRNASSRIAHLDHHEGAESFSLEQLKTLKRGVLIKKFSSFDSTTSTFHCRFPTSSKCPNEFPNNDWASLLVHLLQHREECERKGIKNPRFYETLMFPAVPKDEQEMPDFFDEDGDRMVTPTPTEEDTTPLSAVYQALELRRKTKNSQPRQVYADPYRNWKKYCHLAASDRIESVVLSLRANNITPRCYGRSRTRRSRQGSTLLHSKSPVDSHRRVSIFNPMTKESRPSVIQLSPAEPLPSTSTSSRQLIVTPPEPSPNRYMNSAKFPLTSKVDPNPNAWRETLHGLVYPESIVPPPVSPPLEVEPPRLSVICSNPIVESRRPTPEPIDMTEDLKLLRTIRAIMEEEKEEKKHRRVQNNIAKRLQPVQPDSIFTIEQTFGTRRNNKRISDVFGFGAGTDKDMEKAMKASMKDDDDPDESSSSRKSNPRSRRHTSSRKSSPRIMTQVST